MTKLATVNSVPVYDSAKFQKKLKVTLPYYPSPRDDEFPALLAQQTHNFKARLAGGGVKECAIVVMGDSNSGKSKMLEYHMSRFPDLQPKMAEDGTMYSPVLMVEAPGSCTPKAFPIAMLAAIGIPATSRASEFELYALLKRVLKLNKIECVVVDEMQHAIRGTKDATIKKVQDVLKSLLQIDDWPIHFIFVGTHELSRFLMGDRQLANRCTVMRLLPLDYQNKDHMAYAQRLTREIVVDTAELKIGWKTNKRLPERLTRASEGALGALITYVQQACIRAIDEDRKTVRLEDFAAVYRAKTGCMKADNIFLSENWEVLDPAMAVADLDRTK
ncbi:TniB family NTP-binding protein [Aliirhizobium cellulosilyticum]|uniref:AAA family ATPase n=1 Tax=Aliirhizobium cellulosilyticum TaxID=393664 RepID=A0A7W6Y2B7_9HYPH|nr:TniB family NTP-binding protein [Rhizobium cellulosilyticum]MBB4349493.1 hypothetical protein [Rhizobium cellulosilyticum]MBB4412285.1 hypothetical protein [Rhizobium cellulosilyticum]MBB4446916.1 hypothetical protein [Rhizobium cellulosilyticum]